MSIRAIKIKAANEIEISEVPRPKLRDNYVLVKTKAMGLNPTDWKHYTYAATPGATVGCDFSGTVLEVGSSVTKDLKVGDRVWGFAHGANKLNLEDGTFAEIITAKSEAVEKIPDSISFEQAASLGVGVVTVGQGLYQSLGLPLPSAPSAVKFPVLIYGGSTATGALAIQFAKLSGLEVITTCSPHNFDYVKSLGADVVLDYSSSTLTQDLQKSSTCGPIKHVFDCISEGTSMQNCAHAFSPDGGAYSALLFLDAKVLHAVNPNITVRTTLAYTALGNSIDVFGYSFPASHDDLEFMGKFVTLANALLASGQLKPHKVSVNEHGNGFEGAVRGMQYMKDGKVSGCKLVYTLE